MKSGAGAMILRVGMFCGLLLACGLLCGSVAGGERNSAGRDGNAIAPMHALQSTPAHSTAAATATSTVTQPLPARMLAFLNDGGPLMWAILLASIVGLTFSLERFFSLRTRAHMQPDLEERVDWLLENESRDAALEYLSEKNILQARALSVVVQRCEEGRKVMEQALDDELARALWDERRNIKPVGAVATVAPLLGLLGTVMGMIDAFRSASESGMDNPALFAGGIYMALYTTAFGLIVAIPFLLIHNFLRGRAELLLRRVEDQTLRYIARREFAPIEEDQAA